MLSQAEKKKRRKKKKTKLHSNTAYRKLPQRTQNGKMTATHSTSPVQRGFINEYWMEGIQSGLSQRRISSKGSMKF